MSPSRRRRRAQAEAAAAAATQPTSAASSTRTPSAVVSSGNSPWRDGLGLTATRAVQVIAIVALLAGVIWGLRTLSVVVIPVILALIFASAFAPLMTWMRRRGIPSTLATVLALLAILLVLSGAGWLITTAVRNQWSDLADSASRGFDQLVGWIESLPFGITIDQEHLAEWWETIRKFILTEQFGNTALQGVGAVASFVTGLVLMTVILFFFLKDGPQIWAFMLRPFRGEAEARAQRIGAKSVDTLGAYVRGTAAVAAVDAIGIGVGLAICQVPLALPLAILVFVLAFIPIVGATLAGILAALVALVDRGPLIALIVVGIVIAVNQLEGNFLQPVLMGRSLKLHSLVILIALTVGTALGGVLGAVLAVPITAVAWGMIQVWDGPDTPARWARPKPKTPQRSAV